MNPLAKIIPILLVVSCTASGCATVDSGLVHELDRATTEFLFNNDVRLTNIGYRILESLAQGAPGSASALPFAWSGLNRKLQSFYHTSSPKGVMVVDVLPDLGSLSLGLKRGDELIRYQGVPVDSPVTLLKLLGEPQDSKWATVRLRRAGREWDKRVPLLSVPFPCSFVAIGTKNEIASELVYPNAITVSSPMLHFVENEEELAFVLAHEIAHILLGHGRTQVADAQQNIANAVAAGVVAGLLNTPVYPTYSAKPGPYRTKDEPEADSQALRYLLKSGYNPVSALDFLKRVEVGVSKEAGQESYRKMHPVYVDRLALVKRSLTQMGIDATSSGSVIVTPETNLWERSFAEDYMLGAVMNSGADPEGIGKVTAMGLAEGSKDYLGQDTLTKREQRLIFPPEVRRIYWHAELDEKLWSKSETYHIAWFNARGMLYHEDEFKYGLAAAASNKMQSLLKLDDENREVYQGRWRVRVQRGNRLIEDRYFSIGGVSKIKPEAVSASISTREMAPEKKKFIPPMKSDVRVSQSAPLGPVEGIKEVWEKVKIKEAGMAREIKTNAFGNASPVDVMDSFPSRTEKFVWFARFRYSGQIKHPVSNGFHAALYGPDGTLFVKKEFGIVGFLSDASLPWVSFRTSPEVEAWPVGKWRLRVWRRDVLIDDRYFEIK